MSQICKPDSVENLCERLRQLFDKTCAAHSHEDYPDRVNVGLVAVYTYGVRQGRLITNALSEGNGPTMDEYLSLPESTRRYR